MSNERTKMPLLPIEERISNFREVELGYSRGKALEEASRCLECKEPKCVQGCAVGIDIPAFIKEIKQGNEGKAMEIIEKSNPFPRVCGRICQHEMQCEKGCILNAKENAIAIGALERYVSDNSASTLLQREKSGKRIAVIGSGPSGLTVAKRLALLGYSVKVLEAGTSFGGIIKYGVPEFRLPKSIVEEEIRGLIALGVEFEPHAHVNEAEDFDGLLKEFDAVFFGVGVGEARRLEIKGKHLEGIFPAVKFLVNVNMQLGESVINRGEKVAVIGSGFVGLDAARTVIRLGGEATIVTRESAEESIIGKGQLREAEEEGVKFIFGYTPIEFLGNVKLEAVKIASAVKIRRKDGRVDYKAGKETQEIPADKAILAIGQRPKINKLLLDRIGHRKGLISAEEHTKTRLSGVFAAGDCVTGPRTVIEAISFGNKAAQDIDEYLHNKEPLNENNAQGASNENK